jgi:hypothetical protein
MATWELSTEYKKSSIERQYWYKEDKVIIREEGYRWGTFTVESDDMPISHKELIENDEYELSCIDNDECWELVDMIDGCWADTESGRNCTDEDLAAFEDAWEENYYEGVEELGWTLDDTEYSMTGPLHLKNVDTGEEFSGLVDPTTIVHKVELPSEEVLPELAPIVNEGAHWPTPNSNFKETAKWPFERPQEGPKVEVVEEDQVLEVTDWFPVKINPVRKGVYEILTQESINWPYPNKGEWTGKKWVFLDHTVTHWRGLAKDPGAK